MKNNVAGINNYLNGLNIDRVVVGIDGYSGIGKTTISNEIEKTNKNVKVLHLDDYVVTANTKEELEPQILNNSKNLNLQWTNVIKGGFQQLKKEIEEFKESKTEKNILLIEGIFFCHPDVLRDSFDKKIFLDGDEKIADTRRILREKERWGDKYFEEDHPDSFARLFKLAWQKYKILYKPKEKADFVIFL